MARETISFQIFHNPALKKYTCTVQFLLNEAINGRPTSPPRIMLAMSRNTTCTRRSSEASARFRLGVRPVEAFHQVRDRESFDAQSIDLDAVSGYARLCQEASHVSREIGSSLGPTSDPCRTVLNTAKTSYAIKQASANTFCDTFVATKRGTGDWKPVWSHINMYVYKKKERKKGTRKLHAYTLAS